MLLKEYLFLLKTSSQHFAIFCLLMNILGTIRLQRLVLLYWANSWNCYRVGDPYTGGFDDAATAAAALIGSSIWRVLGRTHE